MAYGYKNKTSRSDSVVTIFALFAILLAGGISIATISTDQNNSANVIDNPLAMAEQAAYAGIQAAKGHIECHGLAQGGFLPRQYYANGGRFEVSWDDVDLSDSTVLISSIGIYEFSDEKTLTSRLETVIKVDLIPSHEPPIMNHYYSRSPGSHPPQ